MADIEANYGKKDPFDPATVYPVTTDDHKDLYANEEDVKTDVHTQLRERGSYVLTGR